ncbi:MAG TPA: zinc ribbon domain-containing protein [Actinomycetales bacterium]|nr:zinc ribbon domain-containing protein [Actinomycetales bacterium]
MPAITTTDETLVGTRCPDCDRSFYPARPLCPTCYRDDLPSTPVGPEGQLATWTVVRMSKKFPTPYALCYADLPGDVRVLGRVTNWAEGMVLRAGMTVRTHAVNEVVDGRPVTTAHTFTIDPSQTEG